MSLFYNIFLDIVFIFAPESEKTIMKIIEGMEISYYKPAVKSVRNHILNGKLNYK